MNNLIKNRNTDRTYLGLALLVVGSLFLIDNLGANLPEWLISWPMLLIVIGLVSGTKHQFRKPGAFILIALGTVFILKKFFLISISIFPIFLIGAGLWIVFKRQNHFDNHCKVQ